VLFIDVKKAYDSVRREVLYNILTEFGITMKLVRLVKMCLNETYSRVRVGKHLSDTFPIKNGVENSLVFTQFFILFYCLTIYCLQHKFTHTTHGRHIFFTTHVATHTLFTTSELVIAETPVGPTSL
jgi:hypothetical protein